MSGIRSVLIANRGEIACRVMRSAVGRGLRTVAVYSDADANALHVRMADEAVCIGGAAPAESYLNIEAIINAAKKTAVDAIHPGYGFLAERADFAEACADAGIAFIGPDAASIAAMGDKAASKRLMIEAGVPTIPGYQGEDQSDAVLEKAATEIGYPVMLKASAGGGGRGQRIVEEASAFNEALASARREAKNAFGDDRMIIEKAVIGARHVEVQIIADAHGGTFHLGERDCSLQRRRQKVIEEAPSPVVTPELRERMGEAAVAAARAVSYRSAGTVEFLLDPKTGEFYFLEMNTRIQVEHPVTEIVMDVDLVEMQFDVAEGRPLDLYQEDLTPIGWAIEARLYAEDPDQGFLPQTGDIALADFPPDDAVRCDAGIETGDAVSAFYDPMIAKVIAAGATRDEARERLAGYLTRISLLGVKTNAAFLVNLLRDDAFAAGEADITHVEDHLSNFVSGEAPVSAEEAAIAAFALRDVHAETDGNALLAGWSSRGRSSFPVLLADDEERLTATASLERAGDGFNVSVQLGDANALLEGVCADGVDVTYRHDNTAKRAVALRRGDDVFLKLGAGHARLLTDITFRPAAEAGAGADIIRAPMAGVVTAIHVAPGASVAKGEVVAAIEAMKMEHQLKAPRDGVIEEIPAAVGDQVAIRATIISLERE